MLTFGRRPSVKREQMRVDPRRFRNPAREKPQGNPHFIWKDNQGTTTACMDWKHSSYFLFLLGLMSDQRLLALENAGARVTSLALKTLKEIRELTTQGKRMMLLFQPFGYQCQHLLLLPPAASVKRTLSAYWMSSEWWWVMRGRKGSDSSRLISPIPTRTKSPSL